MFEPVSALIVATISGCRNGDTFLFRRFVTTGYSNLRFTQYLLTLPYKALNTVLMSDRLLVSIVTAIVTYLTIVVSNLHAVKHKGKKK